MSKTNLPNRIIAQMRSVFFEELIKCQQDSDGRVRKKLYSNCLVLVGSRDGFESVIYIRKKVLVSQSN